MPQRNRNEREQEARRAGKRVTVRTSDLNQENPAASAHATKKSRGVVGTADLPDRTVSARKPPGAGKSRSLPLGDFADRMLPADAKRRALPREEAAHRRALEGHPDRLSPGKKRRGEF